MPDKLQRTTTVHVVFLKLEANGALLQLRVHAPTKDACREAVKQALTAPGAWQFVDEHVITYLHE